MTAKWYGTLQQRLLQGIPCQLWVRTACLHPSVLAEACCAPAMHCNAPSEMPTGRRALEQPQHCYSTLASGQSRIDDNEHNAVHLHCMSQESVPAYAES